MAISKTKYKASEAEIRELFSHHKVGNVQKIAPLGNGEFNAAYKVMCDDGMSYALKIAPPEGTKVLTYENNMMESEVFWYSQMHENTDIINIVRETPSDEVGCGMNRTSFSFCISPS